MATQGKAEYVILSGAHPGGKGGVRVVSEANAMAKYAQRLLGNDLDPQR